MLSRAGGGGRGGGEVCAEDGGVAGGASGSERVYDAVDEKALRRKRYSSAEGEASGRRVERAKAGGVLGREERASWEEGEERRMAAAEDDSVNPVHSSRIRLNMAEGCTGVPVSN